MRFLQAMTLGTPGKTSIFSPVRNATSAVPPLVRSPGSVIKVPPGAIGSATNPSNNTGGTPPSPPKTLTVQQPQTQQTTGQQHHHKGNSQGAYVKR